MAKPALYKRLDTYNKQIVNDYRDKWGTLLQFLSINDTEQLKQMSDKMSQNNESQKALAQLSVKSPILSNSRVSLKTPHNHRYKTIDDKERAGHIVIAPGPKENLFDRYQAGDYSLSIPGRTARRQSKITLDPIQSSNGSRIPAIKKKLNTESKDIDHQREIHEQFSVPTKSLQFSHNEPDVDPRKTQSSIAISQQNKQFRNSINGKMGWNYLMGVEATSTAETGESVLKLGGFPVTTKNMDTVKKSVRQVDMQQISEENDLQFYQVIQSQGSKREMHKTIVNFGNLSNEERDSETRAITLDSARKGIKTNSILTRTLKNKLTQATTTRRSQVMHNSTISPSYLLKQHQLSSPNYDIPSASSPPVKELEKEQNQTGGGMNAQLDEYIKSANIQKYQPQAPDAQDQKASMGHLQRELKHQMISQLPTPWTHSGQKKLQSHKFNHALREQAANMLKTQRYEVSEFVYQRQKKHLRFGSDLKREQRRVNVVSEDVCQLLDQKKQEMNTEERAETETDWWRTDILDQEQIKLLDGMVVRAKKHQDQLASRQLANKWMKCSKANSMIEGPGYEKLKHLYSSYGQGNDDFDRPQEKVMHSKKHKNVLARTQAVRPSMELTAFGFPTIHPNYPHRDENKIFVQMQSGCPGQYTGQMHSKFIENENLISDEHHLMKAVKISDQQNKQKRNSKLKEAKDRVQGLKAPLIVTNNVDKDKKPAQPKPRNQMQEIACNFADNRIKWGVRNEHQGFNQKVATTQLLEAGRIPFEEHIIIEANEMDERLMEVNQQKQKFKDGKTGNAVIHFDRQQKWLNKRQKEPHQEGNIEQMKRQKETEKQKQHIQLATDLFYIWDADGEGSLSTAELCLAFVRIGLSHDHQFAKKILNSITPQVKDSSGDDDVDIRLKDFISIFRSDEISDRVIKYINNEIAFNKMQVESKKIHVKQQLKAKIEHTFAGEQPQQQQSAHQLMNIVENMASAQYAVTQQPQPNIISGGDSINQTVQVKQQQHQQITSHPESMRSSLKEFHKAVDHNELMQRKDSRGDILIDIPKMQPNIIMKGRQSPQTHQILVSKESEEQLHKGQFVVSNQGNHTVFNNYNNQQDGEQYSIDLSNILQGPQFSSQEGHISSQHSLNLPHPQQLQQDSAAKEKKLQQHGSVQSSSKHINILGDQDSEAKQKQLGKSSKNETPTFGEQLDLIRSWWFRIKDRVVDERLQEQERLNKKNKNHKKIIITDPRQIFDLPVDSIYNFLIDKRILEDRHQAIRLLDQQLGGIKNLASKGMMSYGEFNKLFCKSMFKQALIKTLDNLLKEQKSEGLQNQKDDEESQDQSSQYQEVEDHLMKDAKENFDKELPLSLKIDKYTRTKLLDGIRSQQRSANRHEIMTMLSSLKYFQKMEDFVDEFFVQYRERTQSDYMGDPMGQKLRKDIDRRNERSKGATIQDQIKFIEDTVRQHNNNEPYSISKKKNEFDMKALKKLQKQEGAMYNSSQSTISLTSPEAAKGGKIRTEKMTKFQLDQLLNAEDDSLMDSSKQQSIEGISVWATLQQDESMSQNNKKSYTRPNRDMQMEQLISEQKILAIHRLKDKCKMGENFPDLFKKTARTEVQSSQGDDRSQDNLPPASMNSKLFNFNEKLMEQQEAFGRNPGIESMVTGITNNNIKVPSNYYTVTMEEKIKTRGKMNDHLHKMNFH